MSRQPSDRQRRADRMILQFLTPRMRKTCALAWLDRLSFAAIALRQGIAIRTVENRVWRARHLLRAAGIKVPDGRGRGRRQPAFQLGPIENV